MSIASEISRLQQAKADIKTAIENKGVTVPSSATLDAYDGYIDDIPSGGGGNWETIARGMVDFTTEFQIPSSVVIDTNHTNAFAGRALTSIDVSEGNTIVANYAFSTTSSLKSVTFPASMEQLNNNSFQGSGLESITLPANITTYGSGVFYSCRQLKEVIIEATTPPTAGANMFQSCPNLTAIYVPDASVSAYQNATNWTTYASKIKGISERPTT